jgi:predicted O-methyltransferase YrrM
MHWEDIHEIVAGVPFIKTSNAKLLYDLVLAERPARILELGIAHGTATCYLAAALDELGAGSITAVDLIDASFEPSAEQQIRTARLDTYVGIVRMQSSYTWFLHDEIARNTRDGMCRPVYDLCIIDGPKNWTIDGAAFFLVDKLLRPGGWIIFDDYDWTYEDAQRRRDATDGITHRTLSIDERRTPHVREIFELLVRQHPSYANFVRRGDWALAQKVAAETKTYTIVHRNVLGYALKRMLGK